jgi:anti-sigma regulatory factor (Ser/Thr protein kinase)
VVSVQVVLLPEPRSASSARDFIRRCFSEWRAGQEAGLDTALLVVTELVTNAVRHGRSTVTLAVTVNDERVLLEVQDESTGVPTVRHPGWQSLGGRGLLLVDAMATSWGVRATPAGKVVWAELPAPAHMLEPSGGVPSGRAGADGLPEAAAGRSAPSV